MYILGHHTIAEKQQQHHQEAEVNVFESVSVPVTFRINAKPLEGMPDPARLYQFDPASLINHDEILFAFSPRWYQQAENRIQSRCQELLPPK